MQVQCWPDIKALSVSIASSDCKIIEEVGESAKQQQKKTNDNANMLKKFSFFRLELHLF